MNRRTFAVTLASLLATGCKNEKSRPSMPAGAKKSLKANLVFLTRDGCVNTPDMSNNLDDALRRLGLGPEFQFINIATLSVTDPRTGYPTPTVLYKGRDLFGMPEPTPPFPEPT